MSDLLPISATPQERALSVAASRVDDVPVPIRDVWSPEECPAELLPWLAWAFSVDLWDIGWTEAEKRAAIAGSVEFHRSKGTLFAVKQVLARFHPLLTVKEWWETSPTRTPHTFEVRANALEIGADFLTQEVASEIISAVAVAKPLRAHFDFIQSLETQAALYMAAGGMAGSMNRADYRAEHDTSRDWSLVLQTEDGEPILTEDGTDYLETA